MTLAVYAIHSDPWMHEAQFGTSKPKTPDHISISQVQSGMKHKSYWTSLDHASFDL